MGQESAESASGHPSAADGTPASRRAVASDQPAPRPPTDPAHESWSDQPLEPELAWPVERWAASPDGISKRRAQPRDGSAETPEHSMLADAGTETEDATRATPRWRRSRVFRLIAGTVRACMEYRVTGLAAEAAFFAVLSLPPLVFGLAGTIGYVVGIFGNQTVDSVKQGLLGFASRALTQDTVNEVIAPTLNAVLDRGRADVISIGFVLALWSGSRALNVFIDTVTIMYGMRGQRGIVKTRAISFSVYTVGLFISVTTLPLLLAGPDLVRDMLPNGLVGLADLYWPIVTIVSMLLMTSLFHWAPPDRLPWRYGLPGALLMFAIWFGGSWVLRTFLGASIGGQSTSIYGPLAAPIGVLVWLYVISIAVLIAAAMNAAVAQVWPPRRRTGPDDSDTSGDPAPSTPADPAPSKPAEPANANPAEPANANPAEPANASPAEPASANPAEPASANPAEPASAAETP